MQAITGHLTLASSAAARGSRRGVFIRRVGRPAWQKLASLLNLTCNVVNSKPPAVKDRGWCQNDIDRFIFAKLNEKKLKPNSLIERRRLIRRASFDLIGLPPTPDEVETFINDKRPDTYEKLIDRLLSNPHYGERWGRHWLDLARFAESHGYEQDYDRPNAYHYRDFVIQALNNDLPYDTFVKWQIAGDEFAPDNLLAMKATGFLAAGTHATQIPPTRLKKSVTMNTMTSRIPSAPRCLA